MILYRMTRSTDDFNSTGFRLHAVSALQAYHTVYGSSNIMEEKAYKISVACFSFQRPLT